MLLNAEREKIFLGWTGGNVVQRAYFTPKLFKFLRDLKKNNDRSWFEDNKQRYIDDVRDPFLSFIAEFAPRLHKINPHFVADPRPLGGSLFRIYRDVRFARDKSPYKTMAAAQFNHEKGKNVHAPGFYLHLEPGEVFAGAGIWHPDTGTATSVRQAIVDNPKKFKRILAAKSFKQYCTVTGEKLIRPPKGYDPAFPLMEYLQYKDFLVVTTLSEKEVCSPGFLDTFTTICRAYTPYVKFLAEAVGLEV
jgi:uncharacterized protein (TIGR02453 family)